MIISLRRAARALLAAFPLLFAHGAFAACTGDCISTDSFEADFFLPASDAEAARFLNQASFGATRADIGFVRVYGYESWIDVQFGTPATLARPFLEQVAKARRDANLTINQDDRVHRWFDTAVKANDQLRQKVAYALSQIVVTSDQNDFLSQEPLMMAEWNDILVRNAFGNYDQLLREATFSPMMGHYLTHLRNRKYQLNPTYTPSNTPPYVITAYAAGNNGNEPDENYAREIMQLFSIGLVTRARDFSPVDADLVTPGVQELPTYDQQMIRTLSRAFTGLAYDCTGTQTVQGVSIVENCAGPGARDTAPTLPACVGVNCRFSNRDNLFFGDPPRAPLPNATGDSSLIHPDWFKPMVCYPRYNDNGRDQSRFQLPGQNAVNPVNATIQSGIAIPPGAPDRGKALTLSGAVLTTIDEFQPGVSRELVPDCSSTAPNPPISDQQRQECVSYCEDNVRTSVDLLFNHPNAAPMVARQLIEHLVTSNPSAGYIDRVAAKFENNGSGVRGDLKAVVKAVLMDAEARNAPAGQFGKTREPMLRLVSMWRSMGAQSGGGTCRNPTPGGIACWGPTRPQDAYFQRPLGAPSVFNFYEPDYQQAGPIEDAGLFSPEYQIINENSTIQTANDLFARVCAGWGSSNNCRGAFVASAPTDRAYIAPAMIDALPGVTCVSNLPNGCTGADDLALIEELNLRLMAGSMSGAVGNPALCSDPGNFGMKSVLHNLLRCGLTGPLGQTGTTADLDARRRKALYLTHLILISPEYAMQK